MHWVVVGDALAFKVRLLNTQMSCVVVSSMQERTGIGSPRLRVLVSHN